MNKFISFMLLSLLINIGLSGQTFQIKGWDDNLSKEEAINMVVDVENGAPLIENEGTIDLFFSDQSPNTTIVFNKAVKALSLSHLTLLKEQNTEALATAFKFIGHDYSGQIVESICLTNTGLINEFKIDISDLDNEPVFIFDQPINKLVIQPLNIGEGSIIHFGIGGIMTKFDLESNLPTANTTITDCEIEAINLIIDHSSSITSSELELFKAHAWQHLHQYADKGLDLNIIEYGQQAESVLFQPNLEENDLSPGMPVHNYFFSTATPEEKVTARQAVSTLTKLESAFDYLKSSPINDITFIYTDQAPNQSNQTADQLPKSVGIASMLSGLRELSNPLYFITNSNQLTGLDEYLQQNGQESIFIDINTETALNNITNFEPCIQRDDLETIVSVDPNPSSRNFTVHIVDADIEQHYRAVLKDVAGKEVMPVFSLSGTTTQVDVEHLAAGSYFLWVHSSAEILPPIPIVIAR